MCPLCKSQNHSSCRLQEQADGRIVCACGIHAWPNAGALEETCRRMSLTITRQIHTWTQSY